MTCKSILTDNITNNSSALSVYRPTHFLHPMKRITSSLPQLNFSKFSTFYNVQNLLKTIFTAHFSSQFYFSLFLPFAVRYMVL